MVDPLDTTSRKVAREEGLSYESSGARALPEMKDMRRKRPREALT